MTKEVRVTVIIPSRDRPRQLVRCLESLVAQTCPADRFDVVVVDDGSAEPLAPLVAPFANRIAASVIRQPNAGPAAARNAGAAVAAGELLAFTDDDCVPDPDWLARLIDRHTAGPRRMIGGRTVNALPANPYAATSQAIVDLVYRHYNADPGRARFFASNNMAIPAALFREIGGFAPQFRVSEDRELCDRWTAAGLPMVYAPEAVVAHAHDLTATGFWRQHFSYGRGAYRFQSHRARRGRGGMRRDMRFHADVANWLGYPFTQMRGHAAWRVAALLVAWQVANAAGFVAEAARVHFTGAGRREGRTVARERHG